MGCLISNCVANANSGVIFCDEDCIVANCVASYNKTTGF